MVRRVRNLFAGRRIRRHRRVRRVGGVRRRRVRRVGGRKRVHRRRHRRVGGSLLGSFWKGVKSVATTVGKPALAAAGPLATALLFKKFAGSGRRRRRVHRRRRGGVHRRRRVGARRRRLHRRRRIGGIRAGMPPPFVDAPMMRRCGVGLQSQRLGGYRRSGVRGVRYGSLIA